MKRVTFSINGNRNPDAIYKAEQIYTGLGLCFEIESDFSVIIVTGQMKKIVNLAGFFGSLAIPALCKDIEDVPEQKTCTPIYENNIKNPINK